MTPQSATAAILVMCIVLLAFVFQLGVEVGKSVAAGAAALPQTRWGGLR